jgi:hypothetical protein
VGVCGSYDDDCGQAGYDLPKPLSISLMPPKELITPVAS